MGSLTLCLPPLLLVYAWIPLYEATCDFVTLPGQHYAYDGLANTKWETAPTEEECQRRCLVLDICVLYNFKAGDDYCHLFRRANSGFGTPDVAWSAGAKRCSGQRDCERETLNGGSPWELANRTDITATRVATTTEEDCWGVCEAQAECALISWDPADGTCATASRGGHGRPHATIRTSLKRNCSANPGGRAVGVDGSWSESAALVDWAPDVADRDACERLCLAQPKCRGYDFRVTSAPRGDCSTFLSLTGAYTPSSGRLAGVRLSAQPSCAYRRLAGQKFGTRRGLVEGVPGLSEEECQAMCDWDEECVGGVYEAGLCSTASGLLDLQEESGAVSFVKERCGGNDTESEQRCGFERAEDLTFNVTGWELVELAVTEEAECQRLCLASPRCVHYRFTRAAGLASHACLTAAKAARDRAHIPGTVAGLRRPCHLNTCAFRKIAGQVPYAIWFNNALFGHRVAGPEQCGRLCQAQGPLCAYFFMDNYVLHEGSTVPFCYLGEVAGAADAGSSDPQVVPKFDTYHREDCNHPPAAHQCPYERREESVLAAEQALGAAEVVASEASCLASCEAERSACVGYTYSDDGSAKTCTRLASMDASSAQPAPIAVRTAAYRQGCPGTQRRALIGRFDNFRLEEEAGVTELLAKSLELGGGAEECEELCSVLKRCVAFAFRLSFGDARCDAYAALGRNWTALPSVDGNYQMVGLMLSAGEQRDPQAPLRRKENVLLPSAELASAPLASGTSIKALLCGDRCGGTESCAAFAVDEAAGLCRLYATVRQPTGPHTGDLWTA